MSVLIFANGDLSGGAWLTPYFAEADFVVAADGGVRHLLAHGRVPDLLIGDLDSVDPATVAMLEAAGVAVERQPRAKDETDLELALLRVANRGPVTTIYIFGVLGGRLDQTLANILLLAHPALAEKRIILVEKYQRAWLIQQAGQVSGEIGDTVSLIPLGGDAHIAHTSGLEWVLHDEWLRFGPARGVSNKLTAVEAHIALNHGRVLCIHTRQTWLR